MHVCTKYARAKPPLVHLTLSLSTVYTSKIVVSHSHEPKQGSAEITYIFHLAPIARVQGIPRTKQSLSHSLGNPDSGSEDDRGRTLPDCLRGRLGTPTLDHLPWYSDDRVAC